MPKQIKAKEGNFQALLYSAWAPLPVITNMVLGLNYKFTHLAYVITPPLVAGLSFSVNIESGYVIVDPANYTSYGYFDLAGVFVEAGANGFGGDKIEIILEDWVTSTLHHYRYTVTSRYPTLATLAAFIANELNQDPRFNVSYIANSLGGEVVMQPLTYTPVTPSYTVSTTSAPGAGTITAGGATFVPGVGGGTLPPQPISDQTSQGIEPSATAIVGDTLFPVDIILPTFTTLNGGLTGTIFANANFDAIWPINSSLTFTTSSITPGASSFAAVALYGVPVDNHRFLPATLPRGFQIDSEIL
jgi:hypothetical protein